MSAPTFMVLDLEVENHPHFGDVAPPFHPENYIVAPAFALDADAVQSWYFTSRVEADASDWFKVPDSVQYIVAHNATFELVWLMHRHLPELMKFLKRGGRVICTQLAEYLLSHQTDLYPALDEVAPEYGGTQKIDAVKLLWEQGYLTSQIEKSLLLEYLAGPAGDIENTRRVIFGQIPKLQEQGMWQMYLDRCDAMLYAAFCKFFGMYVNREQADRDGAALADEIRDILPQLNSLLPDDLPDKEQFNWGSDFHLSALIFGGPIKFKVRVPYDPPKYEKVEAWQREHGAHVIISPYNEPPDDAVRYKSGKNKGMAKVFSIDGSTEKLKWGEALYTFPGMVKFTDLPDDVARAYTDKRGEFRGKRYLCDREEDWSEDGNTLLTVRVEGTPVYSTSGDSLDLLTTHTEHVLPAMLKKLADKQKIHGTYYVGMLQQVDENSILRRAINNTSTVTGRLSSGLQQMPRGGTVKGMFWSRFPGGSIIESDFTALEVVHLATLSGDKALLKYLQDGTDMHILRLGAKLHRPYEELLAIYKDEGHPEHASIKSQRQDVKPLAFQYQYGGTAQGMAFKIKGLSAEAAQEFIDNENKLFPESSNYRYVIETEVLENAKHCPISREQTDSGAWQVYRRSYCVAPSGTRYSFRQYPKTEWVAGKKQTTMQFKISQLANYACQGEASLVMQIATGLIIRWLISQDFYNYRVLPISTVHDAAYLDSAPEFVNMAANHTKALMGYAPKYMAQMYPGYAALGIADIPYPAVPEAGPNMGQKHHIEEEEHHE